MNFENSDEGDIGIGEEIVVDNEDDKGKEKGKGNRNDRGKGKRKGKTKVGKPRKQR